MRGRCAVFWHGALWNGQATQRHTFDFGSSGLSPPNRNWSMTGDDKKMTLSQPDINEDDIEAVAGCLRSGRPSRGPCVVACDSGLAESLGSKHARPVSSG